MTPGTTEHEEADSEMVPADVRVLGPVSVTGPAGPAGLVGPDPGAEHREQAERTARMPFIHPHLALMPDAHLGKGATVGSDAYTPVDQVMADAADLVEVRHTLRQVVNVKGN